MTLKHAIIFEMSHFWNQADESSHTHCVNNVFHRRLTLDLPLIQSDVRSAHTVFSKLKLLDFFHRSKLFKQHWWYIEKKARSKMSQRALGKHTICRTLSHLMKNVFCFSCQHLKRCDISVLKISLNNQRQLETQICCRGFEFPVAVETGTWDANNNTTCFHSDGTSNLQLTRDVNRNKKCVFSRPWRTNNEVFGLKVITAAETPTAQLQTQVIWCSECCLLYVQCMNY